MTQNQFDLSELMEAIRAGGDIDVLRHGAQMLYQALIEAELTERIGAEPFERSDERSNRHNGHRGLLKV
jgi:putative transposase